MRGGCTSSTWTWTWLNAVVQGFFAPSAFTHHHSRHALHHLFVRPVCLPACLPAFLLLACSLSPRLARTLDRPCCQYLGGIIVRCPARGCLGRDGALPGCLLAVVPGCAVVRLSHGPPHRLSGQPLICGCRDAAPISVFLAGPLTPFIRLLLDGWALQGCRARVCCRRRS